MLVIPAKAGIQSNVVSPAATLYSLDSRLRGNDEYNELALAVRKDGKL